MALGGDNYFHPLMLVDGKIKMVDGEYVTDLITDNAIEFLDTRDTDKPFFLSVNYTVLHSPWSEVRHKKAYIDMYSNCPFGSTPNLQPHDWTRFGSITLEKWNSEPHPGTSFKNLLEGKSEHVRDNVVVFDEYGPCA